MKPGPVPLPYVMHEDRKAQKLMERIARVLAAQAKTAPPALPKSA